MAKIFDLAQHAGLTPRTVLDVVNGKPVNEQAKRRVAAAIAELGQPDLPVGASRHVDVVAEPEAPAVAASPVARNGANGAPAPALAGDDVAAVLLEAIRAEVRPVAEELGRLNAAVAEVAREVHAERRARIDDLELMSELVVDGWTGVDRRLGRVEKVLARIDEAAAAAGRPLERSVRRLEDWIQGR